MRDELAYQFTKCGKETGRDVEYAIVNNKDAKAEDTSAARFGGLSYFLDSTKPVVSVTTAGVFTVTGHELFNGDPIILSKAGSTALDNNYSVNTPYYVHVIDANTFTVHTTPQATMMSDYADTAIKPSAAIAASTVNMTNQNVIDASTVSTDTGKLTFDRINDAMQLVWKRGGDTDTIVCSGKNKRVISGWTQGVQKTRDMSQKDLVEVVDIIETDFGRVDVNAHRMYSDDIVDLIEFQYFKLGYLIPFHTENPPRTGTYKQKVITGDLTLECTAPIASARIKNIKA